MNIIKIKIQYIHMPSMTVNISNINNLKLTGGHLSLTLIIVFGHKLSTVSLLIEAINEKTMHQHVRKCVRWQHVTFYLPT